MDLTEERNLAFATARLGDRRAAVEILWGNLPEGRLGGRERRKSDMATNQPVSGFGMPVGILQEFATTRPKACPSRPKASTPERAGQRIGKAAVPHLLTNSKRLRF
jgi:hypothetical protein